MLRRARTLVLGCAAALALPAAASAAPLAPAQDCAAHVAGQPFADFGDLAWYVQVPGGDFAADAEPWALDDDAEVTGGRLVLPRGSSATSPAMCVRADYETVRLWVRRTSRAEGALVVEGLFEDTRGRVRSWTAARLEASADLAPSEIVELPVSRIVGPDGVAAAALRLQAAGAAFEVDDVWVDPSRTH
jgi:hypothetical protein